MAVINPRGANNVTTYLNAAKQAGNSTSPPSIFGGVFAKLGDPESSTTSPPSATPPSATSSSAASPTTSQPSATATNLAGSWGASLVGLAAGLAAAVMLV